MHVLRGVPGEEIDLSSYFLRWRACCTSALLVFKRFGDDVVDQPDVGSTHSPALLELTQMEYPHPRRP